MPDLPKGTAPEGNVWTISFDRSATQGSTEACFMDQGLPYGPTQSTRDLVPRTGTGIWLCVAGPPLQE